jgi:glutaredoxin-related protein
MYYLINNKQNIQVIKDNMDKLNKFINTYFLLCFMENVILNPECGNSISDRKVINVIFTAYRIVYIDEFIENALWR